MNKYDVFLFDADNTLFDFEKAEESALKSLFEEAGLTYSLSAADKYKEINNALWAEFERGETTKEALQILRFSRLAEYLNINMDGAKLNKLYITALGKCAFLVDGAEVLCKTLYKAQKSIYIITNGISVVQKSRLANSCIKQYISDIFVSEDVGFQKPHISYFDYVLAHIPAVEKEKILVIGDSLSADIKGGINAGIDACWFNINKTENKSGTTPTYTINSLDEFLRIIQD